MVSHQSASSSSELFGPRKTSLETQGLFLALIKTIGEIFSLCIENRCAAGPFLVTYQGNIAVKLCGLISWMAYSNLSRRWKVAPALPFMAQMFAKSPLHELGVSQLLLWLDCPIPQTWIDQKSGWTWPDDKTKLYSCQSQTAGLLYQIFHNLFCSYKLTGVHGK